MTAATIRAAPAEAKAIETLTPEARHAIEAAARTISAGANVEKVLAMLYGLAYMEGMLAMAKVGTRAAS